MKPRRQTAAVLQSRATSPETWRLDPSYTEARRGLAGTLAKQGKFYEAIREYQEVLRVNPADAKARTGLNETMTRMNNATRR